MIHIFLVDDHAVLRTGLKPLLSSQPGLSVVGEASNGLELLEQLPTTPADVVLLDVNMPGIDSAEITHQLAEHYPAVNVLVLSMISNEEYIFQLLNAGARGYILKKAGLDEIVHGIRTVAAGRPFMCSELGLAALHKLRGAPAGPPPAPRRRSDLSRRETEVLQFIAEGFTNQEIANRLSTSKRTVETYRQNIFAKTRTKNTATLVRFAMCEGLLV